MSSLGAHGERIARHARDRRRVFSVFVEAWRTTSGVRPGNPFGINGLARTPGWLEGLEPVPWALRDSFEGALPGLPVPRALRRIAPQYDRYRTAIRGHGPDSTVTGTSGRPDARTRTLSGIARRRRRESREPQWRPRKCGWSCRRALARAATLTAPAVRGVQRQIAGSDRRGRAVAGVVDAVAGSIQLPVRRFEPMHEIGCVHEGRCRRHRGGGCASARRRKRHDLRERDAGGEREIHIRPFRRGAWHGRRERQRAWRPVTPERLGTSSPQARRAAPATTMLPQQRLQQEGKQMRASATRVSCCRQCAALSRKLPALGGSVASSPVSSILS